VPFRPWDPGPASKDIQYSIVRPGSPQTKNHSTALLRTPKGAYNRKKSQPFHTAVTFLFAISPGKAPFGADKSLCPPALRCFFHIRQTEQKGERYALPLTQEKEIEENSLLFQPPDPPQGSGSGRSKDPRRRIGLLKKDVERIPFFPGNRNGKINKFSGKSFGCFRFMKNRPAPGRPGAQGL